jgi:DNA-binding transcriptional MerR regulator
MSNKTKLKIGEFSKMMQVTVKTLRHYEQRGLLLPEEVDKWTGYRYYSISQMQQLNTIRGLQRQGFTLEEIKELLEDGEQTPSIDQLTQKIEETGWLCLCSVMVLFPLHPCYFIQNAL